MNNANNAGAGMDVSMHGTDEWEMEVMQSYAHPRSKAPASVQAYARKRIAVLEKRLS